MVDRELDMAVEARDRKVVAGDGIALELGGDGQPRARGRQHRIGLPLRVDRAVELVVGYRAEIAADRRVVIAAADIERQSARPIAEVEFEAADARDAGAADLGQAVGAEEGELDVVPILLIDGAVEAQRAEARFPAELVIVGRVGIRKTGGWGKEWLGGVETGGGRS